MGILQIQLQGKNRYAPNALSIAGRHLLERGDSAMIRILVVDDHRIFRQGLKEVIENEDSLSVAQEAGEGREAVFYALSDAFDVVLLDISLPDAHGIDVLKQIKQGRPETAVIMLTMYPDAHYGIRALKAGASGYLTKDCDTGEMVAAIKKCHKGGKYITPTLSEVIAGGIFNGGDDEDAPPPLTDREYQVLKMIAVGMRIRDIANKLGISPKTVSTYRLQLLNKLQLSSNADLYAYARSHGLLE